MAADEKEAKDRKRELAQLVRELAGDVCNFVSLT